MIIGLGIGIPFIHNYANLAIVQAFSPASLFAAMEQGAWYDTSDLSTLYQDAAGTTPVTAVEQPVGLMLDKSRGLVLGPELVVNGGFDTSTGWSIRNTGGAITIAEGGIQLIGAGNTSGYYQSNSNYAGGAYEITIAITSLSSGAITASLGIPTPTSTNCFNMTAPGIYTFTQANYTADTSLRVYCVGVTTAFVDSVSVKKVAGNHAFQTTATSRPVLKQELGFYAESFDGVDDSLIARSGGGSTTKFFWCGAIQCKKVGSAQTLFSDTGTNTGYRLRINSSNQLELSAGNGTAFTTVATSGTLAIGQRAVLTAWHDGTSLKVQIDNGTLATAAFATATAGTAQFTIGKDNNAASSFFGGWLYEKVYLKDDVPSDAEITSTKQYMASAAGVTL